MYLAQQVPSLASIVYITCSQALSSQPLQLPLCEMPKDHPWQSKSSTLGSCEGGAMTDLDQRITQLVMLSLIFSCKARLRHEAAVALFPQDVINEGFACKQGAWASA